MIRLEGVGKTVRVGRGEGYVLQGITVDLPSDTRLALMGPPGSGKSLILRLLAGLETPTEGVIRRFSDVSFPVGYNRAFKPHLSPRQNVAHAARVYGVDADEVAGFVQHVTKLEEAFDEPVLRLQQADRAALAYALAYAIPFDVYLVDEHVAIGSPRFRAICTDMLEQRLQEAGLILATRDWRKARQLCTHAAVILDRKLVLFDDLLTAAAALEEAAARTPRFEAATADDTLADPDEPA